MIKIIGVLEHYDLHISTISVTCWFLNLKSLVSLHKFSLPSIRSEEGYFKKRAPKPFSSI